MVAVVPVCWAGEERIGSGITGWRTGGEAGTALARCLTGSAGAAFFEPKATKAPAMTAIATAAAIAIGILLLRGALDADTAAATDATGVIGGAGSANASMYGATLIFVSFSRSMDSLSNSFLSRLVR